MTPAMQHRGNGVTPAMAIQSAMAGGNMVTSSMMQQGVSVGPGEIPNTAGPFVNGGLHNTSDDSIMTGQASMNSNRVSLRPDTDLESLGGTQHQGAFHQPGLAPLGRPQAKLVPGRMSGRGAPSPGPQMRGAPSPGPQAAGARAPNNQARTRPDSRAGRPSRTVIPSTSV